MPPPPAPPDEYQVSHLGLTRGPFRFDVVEAMILSGVFPKDVNIRPKGDGKWEPAPLVGRSAEGVSFAHLSPLRQGSVTTVIGILGAVGLLLAAFLAILAFTTIADRQKVAELAASATPTPTPAAKPTATPRKAVAASVPYRPPQASSQVGLQPWYNSASSSSSGKNASSTSAFPPVRRAVAASAPVATSPSTTFYTDASGQTYRVSNYDYQRLQQMKQKLEAEETFLEQQKATVDDYGREIDSARRNVNRYSQSSVNRFNAKIKSYNDQLDNVQGSIDRFNRKVDEFNAELRRVGTPIR